MNGNETPSILESHFSEEEKLRVLAKSAQFSPPSSLHPDGRHELVGLTRQELQELLISMGEKSFRTKQLWHWIYHKGVTDFSLMSSISKSLQKKLSERCVISRPHLVVQQTSQDQTRKFLFRFRDGQEAETVYIPDRREDRGAVCISSQVGCTLSCRFCHTGTQRLVRNLSSAEIIGQFMAARDSYNEWPTPTTDKPRLLSTIVLMGMGEPLYNYENIAKAMRIAMDDEGIGISRRRITLSTSGVVPLIDQYGKDLAVNLAISLHAVNDDLRNELVPLNRKYPLKTVLDACRRYPSASNSRRITFEYIMLKGINDSINDAKELVRLLKGIHAKVNLIPFNPWPGSQYMPSPIEQVQKFDEVVLKAGYSSPIRTPRGKDILAACGQLKTESQRLKLGNA